MVETMPSMWFHRMTALVGTLCLAMTFGLFAGPACAGTAASAAVMMIPVTPDSPPDAIQVAVVRAAAARANGDTRPIVISLAPGVYRPSAPIRIRGDFGAAGLVIRGEAGGGVELRGSVPLKVGATASAEPAGAQTGASPPMTVIPGVDGVTDPTLMPGLYQGDARLRLARVPASGYLTAKRLPDPQPGTMRLALPDTMPDDLSLKSRLWVDGYFRNSYTHEWLPVTAVDGRTIDVAFDGATDEAMPNPTLAIDNAVAKGGPRPGDFVIRDDGTRAVRPTAAGPIEQAALDQIFVIDGARNVTLAGLSVGMVRKMAIEIAHSNGITIEDAAAGWSDDGGVRAASGGTIVVRRTVVHDTGGRGIELVGGDRQTLSPSGDKLIDSVVIDFGQIFKSYRAGVTLAGVGTEVSGSLIANGPHAGLIFFGNNHRIHDNEFSQIVQDRGDAGGIYVGRDWTQRGTEISRNYFHDIGWGSQNVTRQPPMTVYLDDYTSGTLIKDNLFVRTAYPVMIGGGQDNVITGNRFVAPVPVAIRFDARGETWGRASLLNPKAAPLSLLNAVPISGDLYRRAYPRLATLLQDNPRRPKHNVIADNKLYGGVPFLLQNDVAATNDIQPMEANTIDLARVQACADRSGATIAMLAETGVLAEDHHPWSRLPALSKLRYFGIVAPELAKQQASCG